MFVTTGCAELLTFMALCGTVSSKEVYWPAPRSITQMIQGSCSAIIQLIKEIMFVYSTAGKYLLLLRLVHQKVRRFNVGGVKQQCLLMFVSLCHW